MTALIYSIKVLILFTTFTESTILVFCQLDDWAALWSRLNSMHSHINLMSNCPWEYANENGEIKARLLPVAEHSCIDFSKSNQTHIERTSGRCFPIKSHTNCHSTGKIIVGWTCIYLPSVSIQKRSVTLANDSSLSVTSTQSETVKPITTGQEETVKPITTGQEETVKPITTGQEETVKPITTGHEETVKPITTGQEETVKPIAKRQEETVKSITTGQEETVKPITTGQEETVKPITTGQEETVKPIKTGQKETVKPITTGQEEETNDLSQSTDNNQTDKSHKTVLELNKVHTQNHTSLFLRRLLRNAQFR